MDTPPIRSATDGAPERSRACGGCGGAVDPSTRHVRVSPAGVRLFCSLECLDRARPLRAASVAPPVDEPSRIGPRHAARGVFVIGLGLASLSPCSGRIERFDFEHLAGRLTRKIDDPERRLAVGPPAPDEEALALSFLTELGQDRWVHPLPGPQRRMPARESRVFGAARNGDRPGECEAGHCGVDLGGEIWGEAVFAVHDGVVDRANLDPRRSGGVYVRLAHRDGKVFTQYFHLAAIPRGIREGTVVEAGDVIGLLGDTGVDHSGAHLHFTISVKPDDLGREVFMDPEPLVALWPLKVVTHGSMVAAWGPGAPLGANRGGRRAAKKPKKRTSENAALTASQPSEPAPAMPDPAIVADPADDPAAVGLP